MATKEARRTTGDKTRGTPNRRANGGGTLIRSDPVNRAIGDVRYIRDILEASQDFFVSGWSGVAAGILTAAGAAVSAWIIAHPERWDISLTLGVLWSIIGVVLMAVDVIFFVKRSREAGRPVFSPLLVKIGFTEAIMAAQGLILTIVFIKTGTPHYIPGAWLMAFGATLSAVGFFIPGGLWVLGLVSFAASIAAFIVPSGGFWCVGFAGGAMCLWGAAYLITRGK